MAVSPSPRTAAPAARQDAEALAAPLPPLLIEAERVAATIVMGVHGRRRPGVGESFWEYRHHRREDGAARVDWRRSARSDSLFVRENEWEAAQSLYLWREASAGMDYASDRGLPSKARRAAVLMTALAILAVRGGERVGVLGVDAPARMGRVALEHAATLLESGATAEDALADHARIGAHGRVVLASDFLEPPELWAQRLAQLARRGVQGAVLMVADPAEETFPFRGRIRFQPTGAEHEPLLFGRAEAAQEAYRARYEAHCAAMRDMAARAGWRFASTRTDRPAASALLSLYAALAPAPR